MELLRLLSALHFNGDFAPLFESLEQSVSFGRALNGFTIHTLDHITAPQTHPPKNDATPDPILFSNDTRNVLSQGLTPFLLHSLKSLIPQSIPIPDEVAQRFLREDREGAE